VLRSSKIFQSVKNSFSQNKNRKKGGETLIPFLGWQEQSKGEKYVKLSKKLLSLVAALAVVAALTAGLAGCDSDKTVTIGRAQWNYDVIQANIIGMAIEEKGYDVEMKDVYEMGLMFAAVGDGSVDFYPDAWLPALQGTYLEANQDTTVVGGDVYGEDVPLRWAIPGYTADEYGITSIEDLEGKGDLFGGKIYGYEAGTGGSERSLDALEAYGLEDEYELITGSVPALMAELKANYNVEKPVMVVLWRPHPIFTQMDIRMLEDPKNVFGTNYVRYVAHDEFVENNPEIVTFLDNVRIPLVDVEEMMLLNEEEGYTEDELAQNWYDEHKSTIETWWP
jgi:glycine betaine/proline transport system substrate-binding protein